MTNSPAPKISVLLPAYLGERYLPAQLDSILPQMGPSDELIISDDSPPDKPATWALAEQYAAKDRRVKVLRGPGRGVIRNVEFLLGQAKGEYIFLSDQDDVWLPRKLEKARSALEAGALLAMHDATLTDADLHPTGRTLFEERGAGAGTAKNILRNGYTGCCMAFRREFLAYALPFPKHIPMHDQWLGLLAERHGEVVWITEPLLLHRRHESAQTIRGGSAAQKIKWRLEIMAALAVAKRVRKKWNVKEK